MYQSFLYSSKLKLFNSVLPSAAAGLELRNRQRQPLCTVYTHRLTVDRDLTNGPARHQI